MKKRFVALTLVMAVFLTTFTSVLASPIESKVGITINSEIKELKKDMGQPFLANSRTFVPLRFISENLGFKVNWDNESRSAIIEHNSGNIVVAIGSNTVNTPSGQVKMDVEAFIKDGRTYVPVRFIAEALGFEVDWVSAKHIKGYINYNYDFYVTINGILGNQSVSDKINPLEINNIISNNPSDWSKTENVWQKEFDLAKNKPYIDYLEANYADNFHVAGYSITGDTSLGPVVSYSPYSGQKLSNPAFHAYDLRKTETGYIDMTINWYSKSKDVIEKTLYAMIGQTDGKYIFEKLDRGMNQDTPDNAKQDIIANKWIKTPSGREYMFETDRLDSNLGLFIK